MTDKYIFSVITAVYNAEKYIDSMINSVITQNIGFNNVQLILIDDGSTDNTNTKLRNYKEKYPDNIILINKKHSGVSSARNEGLKYAQGQLISFLDSDDRISKNTFKKVYHFFEKHGHETDIVSIPIKYFDFTSGEHQLNNKFKNGTRVIDLLKEWDNPQLSISSSFIKSSAINNKYSFDERLDYAEDAKLILQILSDKNKLGVIDNAFYFYRKKSDMSESLLQSSQYNKNWYNPCLLYFHLDIINSYFNYSRSIPKYVQNTLCYEIQWRIKEEKIPPGVMSSEETEIYISNLFKIIGSFDNEIIIKQNFMNKNDILSILKKKCETLTEKNNDYYVNEKLVYSLINDSFISLDFISIHNQKCSLEGRFFSALNSHVPIIMVVINELIFKKEMSFYKYQGNIIDNNSLAIYSFKIDFPVYTNSEYKIMINYNGSIFKMDKISYNRFFPLSNKYSNMYALFDNKIILRKNNSIIIREKHLFSHVFHEILFYLDLLFDHSERSDEHNAALKACVIRPFVLLVKHFLHNDIWIFRDRPDKADDNAFSLFKYVNKNNKEINSLFAISKHSEDYNLVKQYGKTIDCFSWKYKILFLLSDYVISSAADGEVIDPFDYHSEAYKNISYKIRFIFLQHGVTKDDISGWLNKYEKNIHGFIVSSDFEKKAILNSSFYYQEKNIWLTGMPRFDELIDSRERIVTIAPTWRSNLMTARNAKGEYSTGNIFKESVYYKTYVSLLKNERLINILKKSNYTLWFYPHPNVIKFFNNLQNDIIMIPEDIRYKQVFAKSALLITDYSSTAFDFAFLKKPVIYYQFDHKEFYKNHVYKKGYFSYEKYGFGEVETNEEDLINKILEYINNNCVMKDTYRRRVDDFFYFRDNKNCERVFEKLLMDTSEDCSD